MLGLLLIVVRGRIQPYHLFPAPLTLFAGRNSPADGALRSCDLYFNDGSGKQMQVLPRLHICSAFGAYPAIGVARGALKQERRTFLAGALPYRSESETRHEAAAAAHARIKHVAFGPATLTLISQMFGNPCWRLARFQVASRLSNIDVAHPFPPPYKL